MIFQSVTHTNGGHFRSFVRRKWTVIKRMTMTATGYGLFSLQFPGSVWQIFWLNVIVKLTFFVVVQPCRRRLWRKVKNRVRSCTEASSRRTSRQSYSSFQCPSALQSKPVVAGGRLWYPYTRRQQDRVKGRITLVHTYTQTVLSFCWILCCIGQFDDVYKCSILREFWGLGNRVWVEFLLLLFKTESC